MLHRDLKPGNIMIGRYGETLVVNWGLAKCVGGSDPGLDPDEQALVPATSSGSSETLPGSAVGTPAYMSPEQADGDPDRVGPRSDVYSLGATLYCVLAGRPPREGKDARAILAAARKGQFTPLRQLEPSTDRALEAICSKAMAEAPEDRYATPRGLADDVERWMADQPVTAYRDPWLTKARRWLRRHQTAATAAGLLTLIVVIGITSLSLISAARDREALKAKEADGYRREALHNEAESYMNYAIHVSDRYSIRWKALGPDVQSELIRGLLAALERREQDPEAVTHAARAFLESMDVAEKEAVRIRAADRAIVVEKLRQGIDVFERLSREFPTKRTYRVLLGRYYHLLGTTQLGLVTNLAGFEAMLSGRGDISAEQRSTLGATLALFDKAIATLPPDGDDARRDWYLAWLGRADVLMQLGQFTDSLLAFDQGLIFAGDTEKPEMCALSSIVLKGAEVEQSHMPWSRGANADHARAIRMAESLADRQGVSPDAVYNAACAFSLASLDAAVSDAERSRRADRAMTYLQRIAAQGYFKPRAKGLFGFLSGKDTLNELHTDRDLDPIRSRPDFRKLLTDLEHPPASLGH